MYFDNGATTQVDPEVVKAMLPYFTKKYGNASSLHKYGREARKAIEDARTIIANYLNVKPSEVIFTSGGTESDNLAIKGVAEAHGKGHIITSSIEHHAVLNTCKHLEKKGFKITYLPVDKYGFVDLNKLRESIRKDTILVSIMHANNEIGTIEPIEEISKICRREGVLFHTDAVQSFTKVPIKGPDLISISSHKIHGPKGVGALIKKESVKIVRQNDGGNHEFGLRAGTENVPGIVGFAKAVQLSKPSHVQEMTKLRDYIIDKILKIPDSWLNGHREKRLCNNINVSFKNIEGESLLLYLDSKGIAVSTGSACSSHELKPSHVLMAIGLRPEEAHGTIRITLSRFNTKEEADTLIKEVEAGVEKLRRMSPW